MSRHGFYIHKVIWGLVLLDMARFVVARFYYHNQFVTVGHAGALAWFGRVNLSNRRHDSL